MGRSSAGGDHADDLAGSLLDRLAAREREPDALRHEAEVGHGQRRKF